MQRTTGLSGMLACFVLFGWSTVLAQQEAPPAGSRTEESARQLEATLEQISDLESKASELEQAQETAADAAVDEIEGLIAQDGSSAAEPLPSEVRIDEAIARLEMSLKQLEELESKALELDAAEEAEAAAAMEQIAVLESQLAAADEGSAQVERIYDKVVPLIEKALNQVSEAIDRASRPAQLPKYIERLDLIGAAPAPFGGLRSGEPTESMARLEALEREVRRKIERLEALEVELRIADVTRDVEVAGRLYRLRLATLGSLPLDRRLSIKSIADEGQAAIRLELRTARLIWRLQLFQVQGAVATLVVQVRSLFTAVVAGWLFVRLTIVILVWRWVIQSRTGFIRKLRYEARAIEDPVRQRWALRLTGFLSAFAPWGTFLLGLLSLRWAFGPPVAEIPFLMTTLGLIATYAGYRLLVDLSVGAVRAAADSTGLELTEELSERLHHATRWVMRALAIVLFVLWLVGLRLGEGVLYGKVRSFGTGLVLLVLLVVVLRWRRQVAQMYLALRAEGWLADMLRKSGGSITIYLVTPLAFLWLCWGGIVGLIRGIAFSFERTRSATAYLTRRRITKVAEQRGYAAGNLEELPAGVVEALDSGLSLEDMERADRLVGMEQALQAAASWADGGTGSSFLLAGESGLGKSPWLERFRQGIGGFDQLTLEARLLSPVKLRSFLQEHLLPESEAQLGRDEMVEALNAGPRRVVVLQRAENLFLGTVNGYRSLTELGPIIDGTRSQVFWVLTMGGLAWSHLNAAGKELSFLRRKIVLETWGQREVQDLVEHRLRQGGLEVSYAGLMAVEGRKEDEAARNRMGRQAFLHLLHEYSGGNPQIALHYLLRSLEVNPRGILEVKPFRAPLEEDLGSLGYDSLFLLAAVVRHGSLAARQAATATDYPVGRVEGLFLQLLDLGTVGVKDGVYRVTMDWQATVLRVLRRWNILVA